MLSALVCRTLGVAFLALSFTDRAQGSNYVSNDIPCPADSSAGFVHNSYTYIAPLFKFMNITESFFDESWYAGTIVTNTTGTDNVPGATRAGPFGTATFNETLTMYHKSSDALMYSFHGKGVILSPPNQRTYRFDGYAETMRLESICDGSATYIDLITYLCSNDSAAAYDLWYTTHMSTFETMAAKLGAPVLAGDCPLVSPRQTLQTFLSRTSIVCSLLIASIK
ncbi:hypothetical protein K438DRAFT_1704054 [Mycena galopus ATCC 62051]|nr:hypothetical protein K438DRAFT_1704054 [Mycena galopus ATCC 62051]